MRRRHISPLIAVWLVLPLCIGCGSDEEPASAPSVSPAASAAPTPSAAPSSISQHPSTKTDVAPSATEQRTTTRDNIGFKTGDGKTVYELKFKDDGGAKLVDSNEQELARFTVSDAKLKVKLPDDSVVAYIVAKPDGFEIRDETQKTELFDMKRQSDGDWKLKTADEKVVAVVKKRDYGYEIEDGDEVSLSKAKLKSGKSSLRNADDETVLYTKDEIPTLCIAVLSLDQIESLPVRAGLSAAVLLLSNEGN
jgi:hypothetical protein